jgi:REP element-mobilizing transposase RayT
MPPDFQPFDPRKEFLATHRNLPHWQQPGATYFVTFRLADSLPAAVLDRLAEMRDLNKTESFGWIERYLDAGSGTCPLREPSNAAIIASALTHFDNHRYILSAFVVMPNHVHALVQPTAPETLTTVLHGWKSYTAHQLQRHAGLRGQIWQEESFDRIVRNEEELEKFHAYILANPSAANLPAGSYLTRQGGAAWPIT